MGGAHISADADPSALGFVTVRWLSEPKARFSLLRRYLALSASWSIAGNGSCCKAMCDVN